VSNNQLPVVPSWITLLLVAHLIFYIWIKLQAVSAIPFSKSFQRDHLIPNQLPLG